MSDNQFDDLYNDDPQNNDEPKDPKWYREQMAKAKAKADKLEKDLNELRTAQRESTVKQFVKDKGLPEKAVKLIGDTDPEEWYSEFGDVFGQAKVEDPPPADDKPKGEPSIPPDQAAALQQMSNIQPGSFEPNSHAAWSANLDAATSEEDFLKRLMEAGIPSA